MPADRASPAGELLLGRRSLVDVQSKSDPAATSQRKALSRSQRDGSLGSRLTSCPSGSACR
jgi:hypothetical protein